jgi:hypothetical protein
VMLVRNLTWSLKVSAIGSMNFALVHRTEPHPNPLRRLVASSGPLDLHPTVLRSSPDSFSSLPAWHSKGSVSNSNQRKMFRPSNFGDVSNFDWIPETPSHVTDDLAIV